MLWLNRWFGVTGSESERNLAREKSDIEEIVKTTLLVQANAASQQHRPLARGTHAKGVCARAWFEVFELTAGRDPALAGRLAKGIFAKPGVYPAVVRWGNADPKKNSDFKPDVRSMSFSVDLTRGGLATPGENGGRQDFSLQNAQPLPINDSPGFVAIMKVLAASNPLSGLWSLPFRDKLRVLRILALAKLQASQKIRPYQQLRYWSNVPFRHGPVDVVQYSAIPSQANLARPLQKSSPKALQDELIRHLNEDGRMSSFDFACQFLDADRMTYWGKHYDANFWIENASVKWKEAEAPFHKVARLTLISQSQLRPDVGEVIYFDVTRHSTADSTPLGSINRARCFGETASREARLRGSGSPQSATAASVRTLEPVPEQITAATMSNDAGGGRLENTPGA
jgi:hypothetical protein